MWNSQVTISEIYKIEKIKILDWLNEKEYYTKSKLLIIMNRLNDIKKKKYVKFPVVPALIGVMLFPIWDKFLNVILDLFNNQLKPFIINNTTNQFHP